MPPKASDLNLPARLRAAGVHLGASLLVAAAAAALVFGLWYPWPYRVVSGGSELFRLLVSVDVVLGPLITLAVFDRRKPARELRRDLAVVVALQLAALGYGLHTVHAARPVVLAFEVDRFRAVSAVDVVQDDLARAPAGLQTLSLTGPRLLRTERPAQGDEAFEAIQMGLAGVDLSMRPRFWRPWDDAGRRAALAASKPADSLAARGPAAAQALAEGAQRAGRPLAQLRVLPLQARRTDWVVLLDATRGEPVGFAAVDGF